MASKRKLTLAVLAILCALLTPVPTENFIRGATADDSGVAETHETD